MVRSRPARYKPPFNEDTSCSLFEGAADITSKSFRVRTWQDAYVYYFLSPCLESYNEPFIIGFEKQSQLKTGKTQDVL